MQSILSYPARGPWGDAKWRGNASGHVYRDLFLQFKPLTFADPMCGSGTSVEVAKELNIKAWGLDLHSGFNALRDSIVAATGEEVDLCVSHPPYGNMIRYSGHVWGTEAHPDDLSHCLSDDDFHQKMQAVLLNQREATRSGGLYGTLIGDWRRGGVYTSYQAEMIARMPSDELAAVLIKAQHNVMSNRIAYAAMQMPAIMHEYLLLWRKKSRPLLILLSSLAREQQARLSGTWLSIVRSILAHLGGKARLDLIYRHVAQSAPHRLAANPHWQAKVRQILNSHPGHFKPVERGIWTLA